MELGMRYRVGGHVANCDVHGAAFGPLMQRGIAYSAEGNWNIALPNKGIDPMTLGTILLIVLILILIGVIPTWPHGSGWGYYPAGGVGTILVIVLILLLLGRL